MAKQKVKLTDKQKVEQAKKVAAFVDMGKELGMPVNTTRAFNKMAEIFK